MLYLYLLACAGEKSTTADTATPAGDSTADTVTTTDDSTSDDPGLEPVQPTLTAVGSVGVGALGTSFAGYSFAIARPVSFLRPHIARYRTPR